MTVHFLDAGEISLYGSAAAESLAKMFLWTWDIWLPCDGVGKSSLEALIQLEKLQALVQLSVHHRGIYQHVKLHLDATSHSRKLHRQVDFAYRTLNTRDSNQDKATLQHRRVHQWRAYQQVELYFVATSQLRKLQQQIDSTYTQEKQRR